MKSRENYVKFGSRNITSIIQHGIDTRVPQRTVDQSDIEADPEVAREDFNPIPIITDGTLTDIREASRPDLQRLPRR